MTLRLCAFVSASLLAALAVGCSSDGAREPGSGVGSSTGVGGSGAGGGTSTGGVIIGTGGTIQPNSGGTGSGGAPEDCGKDLPVIYRDFKGAAELGGHPDFEVAGNNGQNEVGCNIVETQLGADSKPVFLASIGGAKRVLDGDMFKECVPWDWAPTGVVKDAASFNQWYNTDTSADPINVEIEDVLPLTDGVYDNPSFFPLDGKGFGNTPNQQHNYSVTTEAHVLFTYEAGKKFTFRGDDDLWIFVNGKLAMDLGGMHMPLQATIDFDAKKTELNIVPGRQYQMDIFHAERHTSASNFRVETNITCFVPVEIIK